jgi:hypothetical protein
MIAVLGLFAGCTAIIDGAENAPEAGIPMAHGSQPQTTAEGASAGKLGASPADGGEATAGAPPLGEPGGAPGSSSGGRPAHLGDAGAAGRIDASAGAAVVAAAGAEASGEGGASLATGGEPSGERGGEATGGTPSSAGAAGSGGPATGGPLPLGDPAHGHQLVALSNCYRCHGDNLAGRGFYRNITPDLETGIGGWTDKQIADAVRGAIGPTGELFCASMPLYSGFKDQDIADVIAYLRLIPAVTNHITSVCPGHNP